MSAAADLNFSAPVKSVSIENMVQLREALIERLVVAREALREANDIAQRGHLGVPRIEASIPGWSCSGSLLDERVFASVIKGIDRDAWTYLMQESGLLTFMDATARAEWAKQLNEPEKIPEFTKENVETTFRSLYAARDDMFERGVIQCFKRLSWDYKTNRPFHFGRRIIVEYLFSYGGKGEQRYCHANLHRADQLDDLIRVFHVLDGRPEPDHRDGMYHTLQRATAHGNEWDGDYLHIRWFKKGTGHVTFKRPDLVERLNEIIAKHFPGALPDGRRGAERARR